MTSSTRNTLSLLILDHPDDFAFFTYSIFRGKVAG
jgi:hypothetical protein